MRATLKPSARSRSNPVKANAVVTGWVTVVVTEHPVVVEAAGQLPPKPAGVTTELARIRLPSSGLFTVTL
jgi:hypothetical protein